MKHFLLAFLCLFLVTGFTLAQCPCGSDCKCPTGLCPTCCPTAKTLPSGVTVTQYPQRRVAYCFTLFGSLVGIPAPRAIYVPVATVPVQTTDPNIAAQLAVLQSQQQTMATQLAFDRQSQELWRQQQAQLQVLQAQNATLLLAFQQGKADTQEAKELMRQVIQGHQAIILQLSQPLQVVPVPVPAAVTPAPAVTTPVPTPMTPLPGSTTPGLGSSTTPPPSSYKVYITRTPLWSPRR